MSSATEASPTTGPDFGVTSGFTLTARLSAATRALADRALAGEFGRRMAKATFSLDRHSTAGLSRNAICAAAILSIAQNAPLRLEADERIVGSATLLDATFHRVPLTEFSSTSHTTLGFDRILAIGYAGLRRELDERLSRSDLDENGRDLLRSMRLCLDAAGIWHQRHIELLKQRLASSSGSLRRHYQALLEVAANVPENPPTTFHEALQSLWFMWCFNRLCGNWSGIGRIDLMLGGYLQRDIAAGRLTLEQARELIAHFWIKGCEWIGAANNQVGGSGDAQFYQNIVLAGVDENGQDITNELTYLVLDVVEELHISDFPIAVRVSENTPDRLWRRIAEVQRRGGGIVAIYNEPLILKALTQFGYPLREARKFANDGCWEVIIPGQTAFIYCPFDTLRLLQETLWNPDAATARHYDDFEQLYGAFRGRLAQWIDDFHKRADGAFSDDYPAPLTSLFVEGCIESARGYNNRGARYTVYAPHAGGLPDTANSLLAIKAFVFDRKVFTLPQLLKYVSTDWRDAEDQRRLVEKQITLYGNDDAQANAMIKRVYDDYTELVASIKSRNGVLRPAGISTFGREIEWRKHRFATTFGRRRNEILATNLAPTPGTDGEGPTAVVNSFCSMDFSKLPNGVPLELKLMPQSARGETGLAAMTSIMKTFVHLGGFFLHVDVVDSQLLQDAQKNPDRYPNLCVRISGWSARFATLSRDWQDMIIHRTQQMIRN